MNPETSPYGPYQLGFSFDGASGAAYGSNAFYGPHIDLSFDLLTGHADGIFDTAPSDGMGHVTFSSGQVTGAKSN